MKLVPIIAGIVTLAASLTGCATQPAPTPTVSNVITGDTALLNFVDLASRSCSAALDQGVVEKSDEATNVVVTKDDAVDGFQGVTIEAGAKDPQVTLIFENDILESCYYSNLFALANEGGQSLPDLGIAVSIDGDKYTVDENTTEGLSSHVVYTAKNGLISHARASVEGKQVDIDIAYGDATTYIDYLRQAVDENK